MKKIVSALALGALAFGSASAKKSVNLNYRNGAYLFHYAQNGESESTHFGTAEGKELGLFNLDKYQGGNDNIQFRASGDVLSFETIVTPKVSGWEQGDFKALIIGANMGAFGVTAGFHRDGLAEGSFRVKKDVDAGNWEGNLFEAYKPGSLFKNSYAGYSINQVNFNAASGIGASNTGLGFRDSELFLQAAFTLAIPNSDAALKLLGTVISDRAWAGSSRDKTYPDAKGDANKVVDGVDDAEFLTQQNNIYNGGHLAYTVFAIFSKPSVFSAMGFMKMSPHCLGCDRDQVFVPGAYVELMAVKNLDIMGGFTMSIVEGTFEDYAFDLRARVAISSALSITYFGNISVLNGDVAPTAKIAKDVGAYTSSTLTGASPAVASISTNRVMWNNLHVRFALSDTIVPQLGIGAITDLGDGINVGPQKGEGTNLSITPAVQFFASRNASINVGFNVTFRGIGKEEHPVSSAVAYQPNSDTTQTGQGLDLALALPVLFRVKM